MSEFDPADLVELRVRGEHVDIVGLLAFMDIEVLDFDGEATGRNRAQRVMADLADQAHEQVNFGEAEKQLKRLARQGETMDFRGLDVRIHEFDPRHPDERSELDVDNLPPLEAATAYGVVAQTDEGVHMAGYPDHLDVEMGLQLASAIRTFAREIEDSVLEGST